ncbi:hypothetical protein FRC01_011879 [Tulasnella sp. 417]|nr:hypothetical protein FRC01_011879 [Tulasnella sp. 417]
MIDMMSSDDEEVQVQVIRILAAITSGSSEQTSAVVEGGAISKLLDLASSTQSDDIRDYIFRALGNIGANSQQLRTKLIQEGGLKPLLDVLADPSTSASRILNSAAKAMSCCTHPSGGKLPGYEVTEQIITILSKYVLYQNDESARSLHDSLLSLYHILVDQASVDKARESQLIPRLVHLCTSPDKETRHNAHLCVGQIILFSEGGAGELINGGILEVFKTSIVSLDGQDREGTCHAAANLIVGSVSHARALIDTGLVPLLVKVLSDQGDVSGARVHAACTLSGLATNWGRDDSKILDTLLEDNSIEAFCSALNLEDYASVEVSLKGIRVLVKTKWIGRQRAVERVKAGDGIKYLREVRSRKDIRGTELQTMAQNMLKKYFLESSSTEDLIAPETVEGLRSDDRNARLEAATKLRELADDWEAVGIRQIYDSGLFQTIVDILASDDVDLLDQVLQLVIAITIGTTEQAFALVFAGVVPKLVGLASSTNSDDLRDSALVALANIGGDYQLLREQLIREGGLKPPLDVLASPSNYPESTVYWAAHAIRNYTDPVGGPVSGNAGTKQMIPVLSKYVLYQQDDTAEALEACLESLCRILLDKASANGARETGVLPRLVHLCTIQVDATRHNALLCINQIIIYSTDATDDLIDAGVLDALKICIGSENAQHRQCACSATSNLAGEAPNHALVLIRSGLVPLLVGVLSDKEEGSKTRTDAAWTLSNLARKWGQLHFEILETLLEANCIEALCSVLESASGESAEVLLEGIFVFVKTPWAGQPRAVWRVKAEGGINQIRAIRFREVSPTSNMSPRPENISKDDSETKPARDGDEEEVDASVIDGYMTDDNRISPDIVRGLSSNDRNARLEAATKLRQLADHRETDAIQPIIDSGLLKSITEMICSEDAELQARTIRIMAVLTSGSTEQTTGVVEEGAIPKLIGLASSIKSDDALDDILMSLGNIGADSQHLRTKLIQEGGLKPPLDILADPSKYAGEIVYRAAKAIDCYTHPNGGEPPKREATEQMIPVLSKYVLYQKDEGAESLQHSLMSLNRILLDEAAIDQAHELGLIPRLVQLCASQEPDTRQNALLCVNKIFVSSEDRGQDLIDAGILDILKTCMASENGQARSDACFVTSNMGLDSIDHANALIESGLVPLLVKVLLDEGDASGARDGAVFTLATQAINWGQDHHHILDTLLEANCLEALCSALTLNKYDSIDVALDGITVFVNTKWGGQQRAVQRVKAGDGIKHLCSVRRRNDIYRTEMHKKVQKMLEKHFPEFSGADALSAQSEPTEDNSDEDQYEDEEFEESILDSYVTDDGLIVAEIVNAITSSDADARLEAVTKIHRLAQKREILAIQATIDSGLVHTIVAMLSAEDDRELRVRVASILLLITAGCPEQTALAIEQGVLPQFINIASSSSDALLQNKALLALGNIGADSPQLRNRVIEEGGLRPPLDILADPSTYPKSTVYWAANAISSYTYSSKGNELAYEVAEQILPVLCKYILYQEDEAAGSLEFSLLSLRRLLVGQVQVEQLLKTDVIPRIARLCNSKEDKVKHEALHCICDIIRHSVDGTDALVNSGVLEFLKTCIESEDDHDRKLACWAVSDLVVGDLKHTKALITSGLVPTLVKIIANSKDASGARNGAAWALSSVACNWGQDHLELLDTLLEANSLEAFCSALVLKDYGSVEVSLKGILVLVKTQWDGRKNAVERVKAGDGIGQLRAVRYRSDIYRTELHTMAQNILTNYFPEFSIPARV